ncbi:MAG: hypothetical protein QM831_31345 [Kofleriaceae bacterium]
MPTSPRNTVDGAIAGELGSPPTAHRHTWIRHFAISGPWRTPELLELRAIPRSTSERRLRSPRSEQIARSQPEVRKILFGDCPESDRGHPLHDEIELSDTRAIARSGRGAREIAIAGLTIVGDRDIEPSEHELRDVDRALGVICIFMIAASTALACVMTGCAGEISTGMVRPLGSYSPPPSSTSNDNPVGIEFHYTLTSSLESGLPNAYGYAYRQMGDEHSQHSFQIGWADFETLHNGMIVFGRLMIDMLSEQQRDDGDHQLSAFSPTATIGIGAQNVCLSAQIERDVRFNNEPDRWIGGLFLGFCGSAKTDH